MRILAVLALAPLFLIMSPEAAKACGDEFQSFGPRETFIPRDNNADLRARARDLELAANDQVAEARAADQRARTLNDRARRLQQRAVAREGVELASLLDNARQVALEAAEAKAHANRARNRAANLRAQARVLRDRANGVSTWRGGRKSAGFSTL